MTSPNLEEFNEEEQSKLLSGENYIIFNNLKGSINIWINCDEELQVSVASSEFFKIAKSLFPQLNISVLLEYLNRGDYIFTDKLSIKRLRPKTDFSAFHILPTLSETTTALNKMQKQANVISALSNSPFTIF